MTEEKAFSKAMMATCSEPPCVRSLLQLVGSSMTTFAEFLSLDRMRVQPPCPPLREAFDVMTSGLLLPTLPPYGTSALLLSPQPLTIAADVLTAYLIQAPSLPVSEPLPGSMASQATSSGPERGEWSRTMLLSSDTLNFCFLTFFTTELIQVGSVWRPGVCAMLFEVCREWKTVGFTSKAAVMETESQSSLVGLPQSLWTTSFEVTTLPTSIFLPSVSS
mmetsp:Transcript_21124/g.47005  ORF Transcript_21124/g.47005 Transcript_21124/m.47005 type:complete len:219 (+) Transcript_21124:249-905(+)